MFIVKYKYCLCYRIAWTRLYGTDQSLTPFTWVKVQNFQNPELSKLKPYNCNMLTKYSQFHVLNGQLSLDRLKINQRIYNMYNDHPNSGFWGWFSVENQSQNPEFRNDPENFHS